MYNDLLCEQIMYKSHGTYSTTKPGSSQVSTLNGIAD